MERKQGFTPDHGALYILCLACLLCAPGRVTCRDVAGSEENGWTENGSTTSANTAIPDGKTSLAFVLDVSGSMHRHVQQVADGLQKILNATLSQGDALFHNYVLVPFHDPVVGPTLVTREPAHFEQRLRALTLRGGGDCPEMALTALREALRLSLRGAHVYLFTDARAKDYHLLDAVLALVQRKEAQVVFVLTGDCGDPSHPGLVAFQRIAAASSGHVFRLRETDVKEVISFVKASTQANKVNLVSLNAHSQEAQLLELNVDSTIRELMVSVSGDRPHVILIDPQGKELTPGADADVVLDLQNALAVLVSEPAAGRWQLRVSSADGSHTVRATGVSEAGFRHGFSRQPTDSMRHTHRTPLSGSPTHVLVNGSSNTVLKELQVVSIRGDELAKLSLNPLSRRPTLYNATSTFIPPDDFFYLKVVGTDKAGYPVNRLTPTAIKAELPDVPEVSTRQKVLSSTGGNVTLRCSLRSLLPAVVHWLKDGTPLAGPQRFRGSYDFPLHISRISTESAGTYFCTASNDIGAASSPVLLEIKATSTAPQVRLFPAEVQFRTGDHVKLTCDAKGSPRPAVKWNVAPALRDRVHINGTTLTLRKAEAGDELREITCMASNAAGSDAKRPTLQHVDPPKITGREGAVVTVAKGSSLTLSCAASGTPQPQVRWSKSGLPVTSGLQSDGSLLITGADETDAGDYTCNAVSPAGADSYTVRVYVLLPPQMEESVSQETYKVIENSPFSLQCRSSGSPVPLLEWHKDGRKVDAIAENMGMEFTPERDVLRVAAAKFLHDGVYKCVASNVAGSTERSFRIIVLLPPQIQGPPREVIRVVEGEEATLSCRVVGTPAPTATFLRDGVSWPSDDRGDGRLELFFAATSAERDAGTYVCRATNEAGSAHKVFELVVLVPPSIEDQESLGVVRVRGGSQAVLRCVASGVPSPEMSWLLGASRITGADGRVRPGTSELVIETAREQDAGRYRCNAVNEVGTASKEFVVEVLAPPSLKVGQRVTWELLEGEPATLDCSATGNPAPVVTWFKGGTEITPAVLLPEGIDVIRAGHAIRMLHVRTEHAGSYSCDVVNEVGRATRNFSLSVLVRPAIWTGSSKQDEEKVNVIKADNLLLLCNVTGQPKPVVRWLRDGLPLEFRTGISLLHSGRSLNISSLELSDGGTYVCIGTNNVGSASKTFDVQVQERPSIDTSSQDRHQTAWLHQPVTLACPAVGSPAPELSWFHDGVPLLESDPKLLFFQGGRLLTLRPALPSSAGIYTCEAVNAVGRASLDYILEVLVPPSIPTRNLETRLKVVEGAQATLRCPAQGKPAPTIVWMRGPDVVTANDADPRIEVPSGDPQSLIIHRVQLGDRKFTCVAGNAAGTAEVDFILDVMEYGRRGLYSVLRPRDSQANTSPLRYDGGFNATVAKIPLTLRDAGNYTCVATNEAGRLEKNFTVEVQVPPQITSLPASSAEEPTHDASETVHVVANDTLTLQCQVTAQPRATIVWMKESIPIKGDGLRRQVSSDSETLTIDSVEVSDRGKYTCVATNEAGTDEKDFHVSVLVPPTIAGPASVDVDTVENRHVSLECVVDSLPRATVYWTKNSLPYPVESTGSETTAMYGARVLSFPAVQLSDRGTYSCIAENEAGLAEKSFRIDVQVPPRIQVPEATVSVVEHSPIKLRCIASGEPQPSVIWMRDDIPLEKRDSKDVAFAENGQIMQIPNATLAHSGKYNCVAKNAAGMAEEQVMLAVLAPPRIAKLPSPAPVVLGRPARLECRVEHGNPRSTIEWTKDGELLDERQPLLQIADDGEVVHVVRATEDTEGAYACRATNTAGSDEHTLFLSVLVPPRLVADKKQRVWRLSQGSDIQMECFVFGRPTPQIVWHKDNQELKERPGRVSLLQDGQTLYVTRVSRHEAGHYTCTAENVAGNATAEFDVHVHSPPEIEGDSAESESVSAQLGASLELTCVATGDPEPIVAWVREGAATQQLFSTAPSAGVLTAADPLVRVRGHGPRATLEFKRLRASDAGNYTCVATSSAGVSQKRFVVDVSVPATITKPSEKRRELNVALGESTTLECRVTGSPEPSLRWMKDGVPLFANDLQDSRFTFLSGGQSLLVQVATASDAGVYGCEASNTEGSDELQYVLSVIEPPDFGAKTGTTDVLMARQGDDVIIRCPFLVKDGQERSAVSTSWRQDGRSLTPDRLPANLALATKDASELRVSHVQPEDTGYYTCTAVNAAGEASFTTFLDVLVPPYFEEPDAEEIYVVEGGSVTLECFPRGIPEPAVSWSLYESRLPDEGSFLKLLNASATDAGHYVCQASNDAGVAEKDFILVVLVRPGFNLTALSTDFSVREGEEAQLPCPATGVPEPRRIWYRESRRRIYPGPSMQLSGDGTLTIIPARLHDAGSYTCVALSEAGTAEVNFTLTVHVPPSIRPTADPGPVVAVRGHPARLTCEASGVPAPTVSWYKTDSHGLARLRVGTGPFLDFADGVTSDHEGCYVCIAENKAGSQERSVMLIVVEPPTVERSDPAEVTVQAVAGHNASLRCTVSGSPQPEIRWLRNGILIPNVPAEGAVATLPTLSAEVDHVHRAFVLEESGQSTLNIVEVEVGDSGPYLCTATNKGGTAVVEYYVDVVVPPHIVNITSEVATHEEIPTYKVVLAKHPFSLVCNVEGVPLPTFTWYHDGLPLPRESLTSVRGNWLHVSAAQHHHAGHYLCEASNIGGAAQIAYNVTVWEAPQISGTQTHQSTVLGESTTLECPAMGTPLPVLSWSKDGHHLEAFSASELLMLNVTREEDAGIYVCTAVNDAGVATREISLTVFVPPTIRVQGDSDGGLAEVVAGRPALLECIADGFPRPRVSWSGPPYVDSVASSGRNLGTLRIASVGKEHAGNYTCTATNEAGSDTMLVTLSVLSAPSVVRSADTVVVVAGQPAILWCNNTGDPTPQVTWHKDDVKLEDNDEAFEILPGALYIYSANVTDSGRYICMVQNHAGTIQAVRNLDVLDPPVITVFYPEQKVVVVDDEISLICQARGHPKPDIYWEHNDVLLSDRNTSLDQRYIFVAGGELKIPVAESRDAGVYRCRAENQAGWDTRTATVTVHVPPHIEGDANEVSVQRGGTAVLICKVHGYPAPMVIWSREGEPVDSPRARQEPNGDLVIAAAEPEDSGSYLCTAENAAGMKQRLVSLEVLVPPSISTLPRDQELAVGEALKLDCHASGSPTPHITWMHNEQPVPEETYASGVEDGVSELVLDSVAQGDQGVYTCVAENGAGQHKAMANVVVGVSPVIAEAPRYTEVAAGGELWLHCAAKGEPAPKVFWLKDGHQVDSKDDRIQRWDNDSLHVQPVEVGDAGEYYCLASNKHGMAHANLSVSVLTPPSFEEPPEDVVIREKEPATFQCIASGLPVATYTWFRVGQDTVQTIASHNGTLHILQAQLSDEGLYRCQASNMLGTATAEAHLILQVDGNWSKWSEWSECNCDGLRNRTRRCDSPAPRHGGDDCVGEALETQDCEEAVCPPAEEPDKAMWGPWGPCSTSCGPGLKERLCISAASGLPWNGPANLSSECEGRIRDVVACFESTCPVNGGWGAWSEWSSCSASCGGGTRTRTRSCDSPAPTRGGRQCQGEPEQEDFCHPEACPVHGGWSEWSPWGECSASCGRRRHRRRFRTCDNPRPAAGGRGCLGSDHETRRCPSKPCPQASAHTSTDRPWSSPLTAGRIEELRSAPVSAFIKDWSCPEGYLTIDGACIDEDECKNYQCQHECKNSPGSYHCVCPAGYNLGEDGYTCHDIDECRESWPDCGPEHACFNTRGGFECVHVPCPAGYKRDALESSCRLLCSNENGCGSDRTDVVTYASVALPCDVHAGAPVARLVAKDHDGAALRHTDFSSLSGDVQPFDVRDIDSGVGLVFTTRELHPRTSYRVTLHAVSRDEANSTVLFTTRFFLYVTTGAYPF